MSRFVDEMDCTGIVFDGVGGSRWIARSRLGGALRIPLLLHPPLDPSAQAGGIHRLLQNDVHGLCGIRVNGRIACLHTDNKHTAAVPSGQIPDAAGSFGCVLTICVKKRSSVQGTPCV